MLRGLFTDSKEVWFKIRKIKFWSGNLEYNHTETEDGPQQDGELYYAIIVDVVKRLNNIFQGNDKSMIIIANAFRYRRWHFFGMKKC